MKRSLTICLLILGGFVLAAVDARALSDDNPYKPIVDKNIFHLKPPTIIDPNVVEGPPPPKITLQGITTILGRRQVLFRAAFAATPGVPPKEQALVLTEGEREEEIEVVSIDEVNGTVTFKNHGKMQTLNMKDDSVKAPAGVVPVIPINAPGAPAAAPAQAAPGVRTIPSRTMRVPPVPTAPPAPTARAPAPTTGGPVFTSAGAAVTQPAASQEHALTPEQQIILMEIEREKNKNNPNYPPLPPTPITPNPGQ